MFASSGGGQVALQPEDRREELLLFRLFSAAETACWFTLDVCDYPDLDADLAREAAREAPFAPGTRALVVPAPETAEARE